MPNLTRKTPQEEKIMKNYTKKILNRLCYIHLTKDMEHINLCVIL